MDKWSPVTLSWPRYHRTVMPAVRRGAIMLNDGRKSLVLDIRKSLLTLSAEELLQSCQVSQAVTNHLSLPLSQLTRGWCPLGNPLQANWWWNQRRISQLRDHSWCAQNLKTWHIQRDVDKKRWHNSDWTHGVSPNPLKRNKQAQSYSKRWCTQNRMRMKHHTNFSTLW